MGFLVKRGFAGKRTFPYIIRIHRAIFKSSGESGDKNPLALFFIFWYARGTLRGFASGKNILMFPNDAKSTKCIQAVGVRCDMIATSTQDFTVLNLYMDKTAQNSQLIQCYNGTTYRSLLQAVGTNPQNINGHFVIPSGYACYLKTFDNTLTQASLTWVDYDLTKISSSTTAILQATTSTNTPQYIQGFSYGDVLIAFFLLVLVTNSFFGGILNRLIKEKTSKYVVKL